MLQNASMLLRDLLIYVAHVASLAAVSTYLVMEVALPKLRTALIDAFGIALVTYDLSTHKRLTNENRPIEGGCAYTHDAVSKSLIRSIEDAEIDGFLNR